MLTPVEITRQVILALPIDAEKKIQYLQRRSLAPLHRTEREFRYLRRNTLPILRPMIFAMTELTNQGTLQQADDRYLRRLGPSGVDLIMSKAYSVHSSTNNEPPMVRRTKTAMFTMPTAMQVDFASWEL